MPDKPLATMHAPLTILPAPFPRNSFEKAKSAMEVFNDLIDRVAQDDQYLQDTLRSAGEYDDFTVSCLTLSLWFCIASSDVPFFAKLSCVSVLLPVICVCHV